MRFRRNMERIGELAAYEISKTFTYANQTVTTPLGSADVRIPQDDIVIASILRAGLPLHNGLMNMIDGAGNAFISAYRKYTEDDEFDVHVEYMSSPGLEGKVLILADPMIATGRSMLLAYRSLLAKGQPRQVHIVSAISSVEGLSHVRQHVPADAHIWVGAVDDELTARAYIVPGLGDAGDLAFGAKDG